MIHILKVVLSSNPGTVAPKTVLLLHPVHRLPYFSEFLIMQNSGSVMPSQDVVGVSWK